MEITEDVLIKQGFKKEVGKFGSFYVKENVGVVQNFKWLPCNVVTGEPMGTNVFVNSMEELLKLAEEAGVSI